LDRETAACDVRVSSPYRFSLLVSRFPLRRWCGWTISLVRRDRL